MLEYHNPHSYELRLVGPDGILVRIAAKARITLSEWYMNQYVPKYLRVIGKSTGKPAILRTTSKFNIPPISVVPRPNLKPKIIIAKPKSIAKQINQPKIVSKQLEPIIAKHELRTDIGIGILSFNRLPCIQRLLASLRRHSDLTSLTVIISDESTDINVKNWLKTQKDIIVFTDQPRLGVAGNTNRLLRCLNKFQYGILLNDDVEILRSGWVDFYIEAHKATKYHHFCFRQLGIYGATDRDRNRLSVGSKIIVTIQNKPHGAVIFFTNAVLQKVGFFDENFGMYGYEHVDWSTRIGKSGLQPAGFHDVDGSSEYFSIHKEPTATPNRNVAFNQAKEYLQNVNKNPNRIYVAPSSASLLSMDNLTRPG